MKRLFRYQVLFIGLLLSSLIGTGQGVRLSAIEKLGDEYYKEGHWLKAIKYYKTTLEEQPNLLRAEYKLGETYRSMLDYESAEFYYQSVADQRNSIFPFAGFYLALMQKQKGKYSEAISTFQTFSEFLTELNLHEEESHRYYHKQAKIEIDGCQLAMNQITLVQEDYTFEVLPEPLNSEYDDYAAFSLGSDSVLCLSSARKGGKGSLVDSQFGQSQADIFTFEKSQNGWRESKEDDRFDAMMNTKWGEGSGSFNYDRTKFYYTYCSEDIGGICHIYTSGKVKGKWTQPVALNFNINESGFESKHPNVSLTGDTLFYASNKDGGIGGFDIWMSISAGKDNWGPSSNLGNAINTPFNEGSPFYDKKEKALFFSSDGHRGFGGYDIYIARGNSFAEAEIYNAGMPFNSNSDDRFFFLGNNRGYLSSNREGGLGKFDIYGFNIKSKEEMLSAVSTEETIAGRNSLFTDDYNFDSKEPQIINQIISRIMASSHSGVELLLTVDQQQVYNSLSQDDKDRIEKIVKARLRKMTNVMLRSIRSEDDYYYQKLESEDRRQVDRVVSAHVEQRGIGRSIVMSVETNEFYNSVDDQEREKLDILLTERLSNANDFNLLTTNYSALGEKERESVDLIASLYLEQKKGWQSAVLKINQRDFWKTNVASNAYKVNSSIRERLLKMGLDKEHSLTEADRDFYMKLSDDAKKSLRSLASAYLLSDFDSFDEVLNTEDLKIYNESSMANKKVMDRLLLKIMANMVDADVYRMEAAFNKKQLLEAKRPTSEQTFAVLIQINPKLSTEDKLALRRFIQSSHDTYLMAFEPIYMSALPVMEVPSSKKAYVDPLGNEASPVYNLEPDVLETYTDLSPTKKQVIDKLVGLKYINKVYKDRDLESNDAQEYRAMKKNEKRHIEILSRAVRGGELSPAERSILSDAFTFYNAQSKGRKALINRVVLSRVFNGVNGNYLLNRKDAKINGSLTLEDRELLEEVRLFRFSNERILTENMAVESMDVNEVPVNAIALIGESRKTAIDVPELLAQAEEVNAVSGKIILDIPTQDITKYTDLVISGQLTRGSGNRPLRNHPLSLREHNKEKTVIDEYTDADGNFTFHVSVNDYHFLTEQIAGSSDIRIKNLKVEGRKEISEKQYGSRAYFDVGSYALRGETKKMLDEVSRAYNQKKMRIEIESHTDNTGGRQLNLVLSKNRGNSALDYLVAKGIQRSDVSVIWHGEGQPIASNGDPFGRQLNRRLDVRMISADEVQVSLGEIYLARPNVSFEKIAESFNLTVDQLKEQSGATSTKLRAYQPIRVVNSSSSPDFSLVAPTKLKNLSSFVYKVLPGEDIEDISTKFNVPEELIMELNGVTPDGISAGMEIKIYPVTSK